MRARGVTWRAMADHFGESDTLLRKRVARDAARKDQEREAPRRRAIEEWMWREGWEVQGMVWLLQIANRVDPECVQAAASACIRATRRRSRV